MEHTQLTWNGASLSNMATLDIDGFNVYVEQVEDEDYDWLDCRGKFTNDSDYGHNLKNPNAKYNRNVFPYYEPSVGVKKLIQEYVEYGDTLRDARKKAVRFLREELAIALDPDAAGYYAIGIRATVYRHGIKLGEASVWGMELKNYHFNYTQQARMEEERQQKYIDETAWEEIEKAVEQARENLKKLVSTL